MPQPRLIRYFKNYLRNFLYNTSSYYALKRGITQRFMNMGYVGSLLQLKPGDEDERAGIQLYNAICSGVDLKGEKVLEIGCGRGGGCYFFKEYLGAAEVTGVDLSSNNIKIALKLRGSKNISFSVQNAEEIKLPASSFDVIVNLESSHCYPDKKAFFRGVYTLLKPEGKFVYADTMLARNIKVIKEYLNSLGFQIEVERDITTEVLKAIEGKEIRQFSFFKKYIVPVFLKSFYTSKGSFEYTALKEGQKRYMSFILTKHA